MPRRKSSRTSTRKTRKRCRRGTRRSSTGKTCRHKHKKCKKGSRYSKSKERCVRKKTTPKRKRCKKGSRRSSTGKTCRHKHKKCKKGSRYSKSKERCVRKKTTPKKKKMTPKKKKTTPKKKKTTQSKKKKTTPQKTKTTQKKKKKAEDKKIIKVEEKGLLDQVSNFLLGPPLPEENKDTQVITTTQTDPGIFENLLPIVEAEEEEENIDLGDIDECEDIYYPVHCKNNKKKKDWCVPTWFNVEEDKENFSYDHFCVGDGVDETGKRIERGFSNADILQRMESNDFLRDIYKKQRKQGKGHKKTKSYKEKVKTTKKSNKEQTEKPAKKGKKSCPPGQKRHSGTGRCRKIKTKK